MNFSWFVFLLSCATASNLSANDESLLRALIECRAKADRPEEVDTLDSQILALERRASLYRFDPELENTVDALMHPLAEPKMERFYSPGILALILMGLMYCWDSAGFVLMLEQLIPVIAALAMAAILWGVYSIGEHAWNLFLVGETFSYLVLILGLIELYFRIPRQ